MEIKEQNILRLFIEYDNTAKKGMLEAIDYLDTRFGEYGYKITRSGPKMIAAFKADIDIGQLVVEVDVPNVQIEARPAFGASLSNAGLGKGQ